MEKIVLSIAFFYCVSFYSQEIQVNSSINDDGNNTVLTVNSKPFTSVYSEEDIEGSKYHESDFEMAEVYINDVLYKKYNIIYDAYDDQIEVKDGDQNFILSKGENISIISKKYKYLYLSDNKGYFIVFNKNKDTTLMLKAKKKIKKAIEPKSGFGAYVPPKFIRVYSYFIRNKAGNMIPLKLKKKDILDVLVDKKQEISTYVSSNNLSYKKEKDVIEIIDYYNTL